MNKVIELGSIWKNVIAPSSKSIAIRAIAAGLLSQEKTTIYNFMACDDVNVAKNCVENLNCKTDLKNNILTIYPQQKELKNSEILEINCGESALCYRIFPFIVSHFGKNIIFSAENSLKQRNNQNLFELLQEVGITNEINEKEATVKLNNKINSGEYSFDCSHSSQELTGLLYSLPLCNGNSKIIASNLNSVGYIDLTLDCLKKFGIKIDLEVEKNSSKSIFHIAGNQKFKAAEVVIEGDWSAATNFFVLGAIIGEVSIANLNLNSLQPDKVIYLLFKDLGIDCEIIYSTLNTNELNTNEVNNCIFKIRKSEFSGFEFDATNCPDLVPILVVLALNATSNSRIAGISRLLNKESNRKDVILKVFSMLGAKIKVENDSFVISPSKLTGGFADSHNDHRIAMALAIAVTVSKNPSQITRAECVNKSFPDFWKYF